MYIVNALKEFVSSIVFARATRYRTRRPGKKRERYKREMYSRGLSPLMHTPRASRFGARSRSAASQLRVEFFRVVPVGAYPLHEYSGVDYRDAALLLLTGTAVARSRPSYEISSSRRNTTTPRLCRAVETRRGGGVSSPRLSEKITRRVGRIVFTSAAVRN